MIIRILPTLRNRQEWIDFCSREKSYCYVNSPSTLIDFQSTHLIITLLDSNLRDGRQAEKYSIGSPHTIKPAWDFIKGCGFDLAYMVNGLNTIDFASNARDNHYLGFCPEANVRKFYSKESSIISPDTLGTLSPLVTLPDHWSQQDFLAILANHQFTDLKSERSDLRSEPSYSVNADSLLISLIEKPTHWMVRYRNQRLWIISKNVIRYSLIPTIITSIATSQQKATG